MVLSWFKRRKSCPSQVSESSKSFPVSSDSDGLANAPQSSKVEPSVELEKVSATERSRIDMTPSSSWDVSSVDGVDHALTREDDHGASVGKCVNVSSGASSQTSMIRSDASAPVSSVPASSVPASSVPASSVPASSVPAPKAQGIDQHYGKSAAATLSGVFGSLHRALKRARQALTDPIRRLLGSTTLSEEDLEDLEAILYEADFGSKLVEEMLKVVRFASLKENDHPVQVRLQAIKDYLVKTCQPTDELQGLLHRIYEVPESSESSGLNQCKRVVFVAGINGSGKTTSIAKLLHYYQSRGMKVLVAAADTFRAAATEQLRHWVISLDGAIVEGLGEPSKPDDPAAVVYRACEEFKHGDYDLLIIDTAGRWHNKAPLMEELAKMKRVCHKQLGATVDVTLLTIDATIGQNALAQAEAFHQAIGIDALILTKLDGGSKGGAALTITQEMGVPIVFVGLGERYEDLARFDIEEFIEQLFNIEELS